MAKKQSVVTSLGRERYHGVRVLLADLKLVPLGDMSPKVSIEMRRIDSAKGAT
jgi:hypothetical protein